MAIKKRPVSPRQKMINLMYVVLMAMLALNVSTEVLEGFSIVEESLHRTTSNASSENESLYGDFETQMKSNPQKVKAWFEKATAVKQMSDSLFNFAQQLKEAIVKEADGEKGDVLNIKNKENLEAANQIMLSPASGKGEQLFNAINSFRERILKMVTDERQKAIIASNLTTTLPKNARTMGKNWQEYMFEDMPVAAAVTLLTKLQSDVRYAEGEVLHTLVANIDMKDIRVNKLSAFVIPNAQTIVRGETDELDAMRQAVSKILQTERYRYAVYDWNYGVELEDLYGKNVSYVIPELKRRIEDALLADDRVTAVTDFSFREEKGSVTAAFTVYTIFGEVTAERTVDI